VAYAEVLANEEGTPSPEIYREFAEALQEAQDRGEIENLQMRPEIAELLERDDDGYER
jgi:hypothetical protein